MLYISISPPAFFIHFVINAYCSQTKKTIKLYNQIQFILNYDKFYTELLNFACETNLLFIQNFVKSFYNLFPIHAEPENSLIIKKNFVIIIVY